MARTWSEATLTRPIGALHGHQDDGYAKARWSFRRDVVEAWMQNKDLREQINACGCEQLTDDRGARHKPGRRSARRR